MEEENTPAPDQNAPAAESGGSGDDGPPNGIEQEIWDLGKEKYNAAGSCVTCHQANGKGLTGAFPPLAESEWVVDGPPENLIRIIFRGLQGPIEVKGATYNGVMTAQTAMVKTDEEIAAVLTYVRNSWGNSAEPITPEMVLEHRGEMGKAMLVASDLTDPIKWKEEQGQGPLPAVIGEMPAAMSNFGFPHVTLVAVFLLVVAAGAVKMLAGKG